MKNIVETERIIDEHQDIGVGALDSLLGENRLEEEDDDRHHASQTEDPEDHASGRGEIATLAAIDPERDQRHRRHDDQKDHPGLGSVQPFHAHLGARLDGLGQ